MKISNIVNDLYDMSPGFYHAGLTAFIEKADDCFKSHNVNTVYLPASKERHLTLTSLPSVNELVFHKSSDTFPSAFWLVNPNKDSLVLGALLTVHGINDAGNIRSVIVLTSGVYVMSATEFNWEAVLQLTIDKYFSEYNLNKKMTRLEGFEWDVDGAGINVVGVNLNKKDSIVDVIDIHFDNKVILVDSMKEQLLTLVTLNKISANTIGDLEKTVTDNTKNIDKLTKHVAALERVIKSYKV